MSLRFALLKDGARIPLRDGVLLEKRVCDGVNALSCGDCWFSSHAQGDIFCFRVSCLPWKDDNNYYIYVNIGKGGDE